MSTLKTKKVQLGDNADPSKNFLIEVPAVADGTLSIKRQDGTNVLSIDATGKAVIPGVVGTVAQIAGIPTGQVVERGSNANGEYVRFADGTQICTHAVSGGSTWTFPANFAAPPVLSGSANTTTARIVTNSSLSGSSVSVNLYTDAGATSTRTTYVTAIGRWF